MATSNSNPTSVLLGIITSSVSSSSPDSTSLGIQAAGTTPILNPTTASAVASTDATKLSSLSGSFDSNIVIYVSAASGCAALLGVSALLVYRRRRSKRQLALRTNVVPNKFQSIGTTQMSVNLYPGGRHTSLYAPNTGLMYRPTSGMQTTSGPTLGQSMSRTGWTSFSPSPGGFYPEQEPGIANTSAAAQTFQVPTMFNPTTFARLPTANTIISGGTFNPQHTSLFTNTDTIQPRTYGNTITVVPKFTMRF